MNKERIEQIAEQYLYHDGCGVLADGIQAITQAVNEALEEAARGCDAHAISLYSVSGDPESCEGIAQACAAAIRRMKV